MKRNLIHNGLSLLIATAALFSAVATGQAQDKKPNILFIMGDDIGWMQPSCYHRGLMVGETPNIDRIAKEGGMFMHYYAESSCTAGRTRLHHRNAPVPRGHGPAAVAGRHFVSAPRHAVPRPVPATTWATAPASSARTISAIIRIRCRRRTASRSSGATSITSTRCSRSASRTSTAARPSRPSCRHEDDSDSRHPGTPGRRLIPKTASAWRRRGRSSG